MIWDRVDASTFRVTYQTLLVSLELAVTRAAGGLVSNPLRALRTGHAEVAQLGLARDKLLDTARAATRAASELGAAAAGGQVDEEKLTADLAALDFVVDHVLGRDLAKANQMIRAQTVRYTDAARTMPAPIARLHALGELHNDAFTQLDRAGRRFDSLDLIDGYVRVAMSRGYLKQFVAAARAAGATQAVMSKPDRTDSLVRLDDIDPADFHPNTTAELRLP